MTEGGTIPFYEIPEDDMEHFLLNSCLCVLGEEVLPVGRKEIDINKLSDGIHLVACGHSGYELKNPQVYIGVIEKEVKAVLCPSFEKQNKQCLLVNKDCPHVDKNFVEHINFI